MSLQDKLAVFQIVLFLIGCAASAVIAVQIYKWTQEQKNKNGNENGNQ